MTVHLSVAKAILDRLMSDPAGIKAFHTAHQGLRSGRWSHEYVDSIGQHGVRARSSWPMEQVAAFAEVHGMIARGTVAMVPVGTDGPPNRDDQREANAAALADLPDPFTAYVNPTQNGADADGFLSWSEPIEVSLATGLIERDVDGSTRPYSVHYRIPAGTAPLEIGSSLPSRTWLHLVLEGGSVARWPYGHDCIRLFVNLDYAEAIERLAASLEPDDSQQPAISDDHRQAVRAACRALGHPPALKHADLVPYMLDVRPVQQLLW